MRGGIEEHIHASLLWSYAGQGEHKGFNQQNNDQKKCFFTADCYGLQTAECTRL